MQTLTVDLNERAYPIHIGTDLLTRSELILPHLARKQVAIVTNTTVAPLYLDALSKPLAAEGVDIVPIILPDGEEYKNSDTLNLIYDALLTRPLRAQDHPDRPGRRRHRRSHRLCRRHLSARRAFHPDSDHLAGAGGFLGGRQNRHQPSAGQEHGRRLLPAQAGAGRHRHPEHPG